MLTASHGAFFLLKNCLSPQNYSTFCVAHRVYQSQLLKEYDTLIGNMLQSTSQHLFIGNSVQPGDYSFEVLWNWHPNGNANRASRFLSSVTRSSNLVKQLLPSRLHSIHS